MTIKQDDPRFWDVRSFERRLRKGQITKIKKHLKSLDDVADKQAPIDLDLDDDDDLSRYLGRPVSTSASGD